MGHGGNAMRDAGMNIIEHSDSLAIMGFLEVVKHLPRMIKIMGETVKTISRAKPDRIILIDYPGFNLKLATNIFRLGIPITYFILPQAWAWKEKRVETMKAVLDQTLSIFPFEEEWYNSKGLPTTYVGHPFTEHQHVDESSKSFYQRHKLTIEHSILVLLPGSRQQEVDRHWPVFLKTVSVLRGFIPDLQIIVGKAPNVKLLNVPDNFRVEQNARKAMMVGTAALVSSGTATLECAVEGTPMVVCYKLSSISWLIAKSMTNVNYSSMVNLIANKELVPEFLQNEMKPENIVTALTPLLDTKSKKRETMLDGFDKIRKSLGIPGVYDRAAKAIITKTKHRYD
jgi:lipid-A-disaccharide synthase